MTAAAPATAEAIARLCAALRDGGPLALAQIRALTLTMPLTLAL